MGAFYVNYTLRGASQSAVARALRGRKAFVSPAQNGSFVAFDQESDQQDQGVIASLAAQLSNRLRCTVLAVLLHDSDFLWFKLYQDGTVRDRYNSSPDYWQFKPDPPPPAGGDARQLCTAFGSSDVAQVEAILRAPQQRYPDAMDRHADLVRALNLPESSIGFGYESILRGDLPQGLSAENLIPTN